MSETATFPKKLLRSWETRRKQDGHAWCTPDEASWLERNNLRQPGHTQYRFSTQGEDLSDEAQERGRQQYLKEVLDSVDEFTPRQLRDIRRSGFPLDEHLPPERFLDETPEGFRERIGAVLWDALSTSDWADVAWPRLDSRVKANASNGALAVYTQCLRDIVEHLAEYAVYSRLDVATVRDLVDMFAEERGIELKGAEA